MARCRGSARWLLQYIQSADSRLISGHRDWPWMNLLCTESLHYAVDRSAPASRMSSQAMVHRDTPAAIDMRLGTCRASHTMRSVRHDADGPCKLLYESRSARALAAAFKHQTRPHRALLLLPGASLTACGKQAGLHLRALVSLETIALKLSVAAGNPHENPSAPSGTASVRS